jgi:hypothetical protein
MAIAKGVGRLFQVVMDCGPQILKVAPCAAFRISGAAVFATGFAIDVG